MKTLADSIYNPLKDLHYAENTLIKALPTMIDAVCDGDSETASEDQLKETEGIIDEASGKAWDAALSSKRRLSSTMRLHATERCANVRRS